MLLLPPLIDATIPRPHRPSFEELYRIPNIQDDSVFWDSVYHSIASSKIYSPVIENIENYINTDSGYFGFCVHPVTKEPHYYNVGVSLDFTSGREIYPVLSGVLEYSGYSAVNGYYVLLSHPQIQTEDGYILHTMYCHLKKPLVRFNSYQKMLREISLGSYPIIDIDIKTMLGLASTTGISRENDPGLYLQFSFRKYDTTPVVIDPLRAYGSQPLINKSANAID